MALQVIDDARIDLLAHQGIVKQGGTDADGGRTGDHELDRVFGRRDTALPDNRHIVVFRDLKNLVYFEQRDGLDRRSGKSATHVADDRPARLAVDGHAHNRINYGEAIGTCLDA